MNAREWGPINLMNLSAATTTTQGTATDGSSYASQANREMKAVFMISGLTTITTITLAVTECATSTGSFTAPANGTSSAVVTTNGMTELNFRNDLKYIRAEATPNTTGSVNIAAVGFALKRFADS